MTVYICSIRVLPHLQNTGGFFIAVLQKTAELPWVAARTIKKATDSGLNCLYVHIDIYLHRHPIPRQNNL